MLDENVVPLNWRLGVSANSCYTELQEAERQQNSERQIVSLADFEEEEQTDDDHQSGDDEDVDWEDAEGLPYATLQAEIAGIGATLEENEDQADGHEDTAEAEHAAGLREVSSVSNAVLCLVDNARRHSHLQHLNMHCCSSTVRRQSLQRRSQPTGGCSRA